ncbi:MAG: signal transduction protein, partial [Gammaproteobacteria bacterium]|nr:signal transduction protein [Gammaproteobacteria bacterium]NIV21507.1 signal transduction protein [Gammaproteobacteria bacterium]NIX11069.1 signal transduction protein [Gammaproteobacteria bacterium]
GALSPETVDRSDPCRDPRVRAAILTDDLGRVQAFFREDSLLDIDQLNEALARDLRGLPLYEMGRLRQKYQVRELPPLPSMTHFETAVDERIEALESIR